MVRLRESEQTERERGVSEDDVYPTETDLKENIRTGRDQRKGMKEMKKEEVDWKRHTQNMKVMEGMHTEM